MGVWNPANLTNTQSSTVAQIIVHENFNPSTLINDIAILTLTQPIVLGIYPNINTICLANTGASTSYVNQMCVLIFVFELSIKRYMFQMFSFRMGSDCIHN